MARSQPGETSKPLVIALAFFVLTTLVLGVLTFLAQSDIEKARADLKAAADKEKAAQDVATTETEKKLLYKGAMGLLSPDDQNRLQNLLKRDAVREEYKQMMGTINNQVQAVVTTKANEIRNKDTKAQFSVAARDVLDWEWPDDGSLPTLRVPLVAGVVNQYAAQRLSSIEVQQKKASMDEAIKKADDRANAAIAREAALKKEQDDFPKKVAEILKQKDAEVAAIRQQYVKDTETFAARMQDHERLQNESALAVRRANEDLELARNRANKLEAAAEVGANQFEYDQPHGKIQKRTGELVEINLGTADNVKAGLKFAVMPSDTPRKGFDARKTKAGVVVPKAKIEVVRALGEHLSQARILPGTEVQPTRDSVIAGDLLYNAVWRKGEPDHVALFGVFDLEGDGSDDIVRLANDLTRMGIVVDAWYDLNQRKWQGKLTEKTIYAIQGNVPFKSMNAGEPEAVLSAKGDVLKQLEQAAKDARDRGTKVVKMRDAFPRIGYPVNLDVDERRIDQAASKYLKPAQPGDAPAGTAPGM